jgi:hypothetical protein
LQCQMQLIFAIRVFKNKILYRTWWEL